VGTGLNGIGQSFVATVGGVASEATGGAVSYGFAYFSQQYLEEVSSPTPAYLRLSLLTKDLVPIYFPMMTSGNLVSTLVLQYNPDKITYSTTEAEYVEKSALGMRYPTTHYVGTKSNEFTLNFVLTDDVEGPPVAGTTGAAFLTLNDVRLWLSLLAEPVEPYYYPPLVRVLWGEWNRICTCKKVEITAVRHFAQGTPRIYEVKLTMKPIDPTYLITRHDFDEVRDYSQ